jgi:phosphatidylglycerophosphate synthase
MTRRCIVLADAPDALVERCGITVLERLLRTLSRLGIKQAIILSRRPEQITMSAFAPARSGLQVEARRHDADTIAGLARIEDGPLLVARGDSIFDPRLLGTLARQSEDTALIGSDSDNSFCGAVLLGPNAFIQRASDLLNPDGLIRIEIAAQPAYSPSLRRDLPPFCFSPATIANRELVERRLVDDTQKGAQDFPAMLHAPIEKFLVARLCRTAIAPNQLTILWIALAFIVTLFFATGWLATAIVLAFIIGILDGLDGKLARLRVETSSVGTLEHRFDSFFEVAWPAALAFFLHRSGQLPGAFAYFLLLVAGQIVDGLCKGRIYEGFASEMRPPNLYDRVVRFLGGRRNVCVWILLAGVVWGRPASAFVVMAWWQIGTALADLPHAIWRWYRLRHPAATR